jgi:polyphosphate kinase
MVTPRLADKARLFVLRHFSKHIPAWMRFHDLEHTLTVTRHALEIGRAEGLPEKDMLLVELAALFHDVGYAVAYEGHEEAGAELAHAWLMGHGATAAEAGRVSRLILATRLRATPKGKLQQVLRDADSAKAGQADFMEKGERLRQERRHWSGTAMPPRAWRLENLTYMEGHRFYTAYAQRRFGGQKEQNLSELRRAVAGEGPAPSTVPGREPYMDRDLSWLAFNARVLQEAKDPEVPLLERLKFVAIHSSNLDEFYRVRVSQLRSLRKLGKRDRSALEVTPGKRLEQINRVALAQQAELGKLYREDLLPGLRKAGIRLIAAGDLNKVQHRTTRAYFEEKVSHLLHPVPLRREGLPFMEDRRLYLVLTLLSKSSGAKRHLVCNIPSEELGRFFTLPSAKGRTELIYLDDVIRLGLVRHFKGWRLKGCHAIKLSRDADLYLEEEFTDNVAEKVRRSLRKRRTGMPARFLYDGSMHPELLERVRMGLRVKKSECLEGGRYHNLSDLMQLPVPGRPELRYPPRSPMRHPDLQGKDLFAAMRKKDVLLQFPFHSFGPITDWLHQAARDPQVGRIAATLYRVARNSAVCEALVEAARKGKRVEVVMEARARFDEGNNLLWGAALEQAGAKVVYGLPGLKVHGKLLLVERRERGKLRRYTCLSTGNFNEETARTYADLALLTVHQGMAREAAAVLAGLMREHVPPPTKLLITAPHGLREALERAIDKEIEQARAGRPAALFIKLNSLEDRPLIRKLYDADRAGVEVRAIIRGICCLRTGVPGHSRGIQAISIVDRWLEHARVYRFHNAGKPLLYLSSADWMERNLDRRVEVTFPILDPAVQAEVEALLERQWADNVKARVLDRDQTNLYRSGSSGKRLRGQLAQYQAVRKLALAQAGRSIRR